MEERYAIGNIVFGSWTIVKLIGEGSYGKVYEIAKEDFGNTYKAALKVIEIPQSQEEINNFFDTGMKREKIEAYYLEIIEDFVDEFTIMSKLKGESNIVSYDDHIVKEHFSNIGWDILIKMELLTPLNTYIRLNNLHSKDVIKLGIDICNALEICHNKNIIHRDIKTENIFVSETGNYKLGDFGIAKFAEKISTDTSIKGTSSYMAPEIYNNKEYNCTVDTYSLGIVMYKLLNNNRLPFLSTDITQKITQEDSKNALLKRMNGDTFYPPLYASASLSNIILKACANDSAERYQSSTELKEALLKIYNVEENIPILIPDESSNITYTSTEEKTEEIFNHSNTISQTRETISQTSSDLSNNFSANTHSHKNPKKVIIFAVFSSIAVLLALALLVLSIQNNKHKSKNQSEEQVKPSISAEDLQNLPPELANKLMSGEIDIANFSPELIDKLTSDDFNASNLPPEFIDKVASGEIDISKIPPELLDKILLGEFDISKIPPVLLDKMLSGEIDSSRIPPEFLDKIISGEIDASKLPPEFIDKVASGEIDISKIPPEFLNKIASGEIDISKLPPELLDKILSGEIDASKLSPKFLDKVASGEIDISKIPPELLNKIVSGEVDISKIPPKVLNKILSGEINVSKIPPKILNKLLAGEIDISKIPHELLDKILSGEIDISKIPHELLDKILSGEIDISKLSPDTINKLEKLGLTMQKIPNSVLEKIISNEINISNVYKNNITNLIP